MGLIQGDLYFMKVALIVGHSVNDGGAYNENCGINEYRYNDIIVKQLAQGISKDYPEIEPIIIYRDSYSKLPSKVNETFTDIAVEFHLNAAENKSAHGCEMLYWNNSTKGHELASMFQVNVTNRLKLKDRGVKPLKDNSRGGYLLKSTAMPTIIVEPFFLSNDDELSRMMKPTNQKKLIEAYFDSIIDYYEEVFLKGL